MTTIFDTSAVIPMTQADHVHHTSCISAYEAASFNNPPLVISDIVYCEISMGYDRVSEVDTVLKEFGFQRYGYSDAVLFRAGQAFRAYKKNGGQAKTVLADFLIGAQAEIEGCPIVTGDEGKFKTYFPGVVRIVIS